MGYNWTYCNTTLEETFDEDPLWKGFTFHHFGLFLGLVFGLIAVLIAFYLIFRHATHYLRPWEQRHIIRILLMIPIYAIVSFLSFLFYKKAVYFEVLRDCYEAFAIASFFTLLCHYVAPDLHQQKVYFRKLAPIQNWFWGVFGLQWCTGGETKGPFRKPRSGLTWFNIIWIGVFQYCFVRVAFTIVSVVTEELDLYCEASLSPAFAHIWTLVFECVSVTIAMFCLVQFYLQLRLDLAEHRPFLKVLCIKLVIFFSFWQTIMISFLSSSNGPLQPTNKVSYQDIKVGIPSVMLCIEMAIFAVMHLFAFPWKEYSLKHHGTLNATGAGFSGEAKYKGGPFGIKAFLDAFNPWDIIKASARGFRWLFVGYKHRERDSSYQAHKLDTNTGYAGPTYSGTGETATELRTSYDERLSRDRADTVGTAGADLAEDDRAGLLRNSAVPARGPSESPYRSYTNQEYTAGDDSQLDLGAPKPLHPTFSSDSEDARNPLAPPTPFSQHHNHYGSSAERSTLDADESAYHPGYDPRAAAYTPPSASALSEQGVAAQQWDHWAGALRPTDADAAHDEEEEEEGARRPPAYRSYDSHG